MKGISVARSSSFVLAAIVMVSVITSLPVGAQSIKNNTNSAQSPQKEKLLAQMNESIALMEQNKAELNKMRQYVESQQKASRERVEETREHIKQVSDESLQKKEQEQAKEREQLEQVVKKEVDQLDKKTREMQQQTGQARERLRLETEGYRKNIEQKYQEVQALVERQQKDYDAEKRITTEQLQQKIQNDLKTAPSSSNDLGYKVISYESLNVPSDIVEKLQTTNESAISELKKAKSKLEDETSAKGINEQAKSYVQQSRDLMLATVQARLIKAVSSQTKVLEGIQTSANSIQTQINKLRQCLQTSSTDSVCTKLQVLQNSGDQGASAQASLDETNSDIQTIRAYLSALVSLTTVLRGENYSGTISSFSAMMATLSATSTLSKGIHDELSNISNAVSKPVKRKLADVVAAENQTYTSTNRLFVTGDRGIFEIIVDANGETKTIERASGQDCAFGGIVEMAGVIYANCYGGGSSHIYAAKTTETPTFKRIHSLREFLANGLTTDNMGNLYVASTFLGRILRLTPSASDPLTIAKTDVWLHGSGLFTNGIKYARDSMYWTNGLAVQRAPKKADGTAGNQKTIIASLAFFDDLAVDDSGILVANYITGMIHSHDIDAKYKGMINAHLAGPSSVMKARAPFPDGTLIVTERAGNRVSLVTP